MKEIDGWVKIKKYTDDGGPFCGDCIFRQVSRTCRHQTSAFSAPGPLCPIWHGESKSDIAELIEEIADNQETVIAAGPEPQFDADEPRYSVHITGPKRLLEKFADLILNHHHRRNKP